MKHSFLFAALICMCCILTGCNSKSESLIPDHPICDSILGVKVGDFFDEAIDNLKKDGYQINEHFDGLFWRIDTVKIGELVYDEYKIDGKEKVKHITISKRFYTKDEAVHSSDSIKAAFTKRFKASTDNYPKTEIAGDPNDYEERGILDVYGFQDTYEILWVCFTHLDANPGNYEESWKITICYQEKEKK